MRAGKAVLTALLAMAVVGNAVHARGPQQRGGRGGAIMQGYPVRPPADPAVVEPGRMLYSTNCAFCHGNDARGGDGGSNLLRSEIVLNDNSGELIGDILRNGLSSMPKFELNNQQVSDIATFIHSFPVAGYDVSRLRPETIVVGDPKAGEAYFKAKCASCHDTAGDLKGFAARVNDPRIMQQTWLFDRLTGERLVSMPYSETANWAKGFNKEGQPLRDPEKDFHVGGSLVSPNNTGVTNWPPPSFSPDTGLFYVPRYDSYAMYYLTETDPRGAMGLGGKEEVNVTSLGSHLVAIDYKTGKTVWSHQYPSSAGGSVSGILTTAGRLLFAGDNAGNLIAYDPANGNILWHSRIGQVSNAPETYMLDGHQYILAAAGDTIFAFTLY